MMNHNGGQGPAQQRVLLQKSQQSGTPEFHQTQQLQQTYPLNNNNSGGKQGQNYGVTQPGLQKILRSLGKQQQPATNAASGQNNTSGQGTATSQRKSSSHKSRRVATDGQQNSLVMNHGQEQKGGGARGLLKNKLNDSVSRNNPRTIDGIPLMGRDNTHQPTSQLIGPTLGTESGGGLTMQSTQKVNRSQSGKRIQRNSADPKSAGAKSRSMAVHNNMSGGNIGPSSGKYLITQAMGSSATAGNSIPMKESRFAQKQHATEPSYPQSQQYGVSVGLGSKLGSNQVAQTETAAAAQQVYSNQQATMNAKYFSQRLQNKLRPKGVASSSDQPGNRSSKEELLRAFINPALAANDGEHASNQNTKLAKSSIQGRNSSRENKQTAASVADDNSKIYSSFEKIKQQIVGRNGSSHTEEKVPITQAISLKNTLNQNVNAYRARLLRPQNNNASANIENENNSERLSNQNKFTVEDIGGEVIEPEQEVNEELKDLKSCDEDGDVDVEVEVQEEIVEYRGMKMTLSQREEYMEMEEEQISKFRQNYYLAKFASKKNGVVVTYAANTHQGMVRTYNEDRVSIILNIIKPKFKQIDFWPRCSFFAIYDGHGGAQCADFLRDQLHQLIVRDADFPHNPIMAMRRGFQQAEHNFLEFAHSESSSEAGAVQRSGSCAIVVLIVGDVCYVGNVGDSRAFMSMDSGSKIVPLSSDHKPESPEEKRRIEANGGKVYQNQSFIPDPTPGNSTGTQTLTGPHRVFPGRLSVSRTIGDIEAKDERYGGNPAVVIAEPQIRSFKIKDNYDFVVIGCDGVFEKMGNQEVMDQVWQASLQPENLKSPQSMHSRCGSAVDAVLNTCVTEKTLDNITCVVVGFNNYETIIDRARTTGARSESIREAPQIAEEHQLDWEEEEAQILDGDSNRVLKKLMQPLDVVEEEMIENSELETPHSEVIDVTRKKAASRLLEGPTPQAISHNSSVSDRYASSSRRQSQLLEAQDTQNLIDHDLLSAKEAISLVNSRTMLEKKVTIETGGIDFTNLEQSQINALAQEEQAGIEQSKQTSQIGISQKDDQLGSLVVLPPPQNHHSYPYQNVVEQGSNNVLVAKNPLVRKDYKIRQASPSPGKVQRQNSDRSLRSKQEQKLQQPPLKTSAYFNPDSKNLTRYQTHQQASATITIPTIIPSFGSNSIPLGKPQGKTSKTPVNENKLETTQPSSRNTQSDMRNSYEAPSTLLAAHNSQRPITPKRVIVANKSAQSHLVSSLNRQSLRNTSKEQLISAGSGRDIHNNTFQTQNHSQGRRKEDLKVDDLVMGGGPNIGSNGGVYTNSFQPAQKSKGKSFMSAANPKNRTQRGPETIQSALYQTTNSGSAASKERLSREIQSQFSSSSAGNPNPNKAPFPHQEQLVSSASTTLTRQRKKSANKVGGVGNHANKSVRVVANLTQKDPARGAVMHQHDHYHSNLGGTGSNFNKQGATLNQSATIKNSRSSASRNKPNYLQGGSIQQAAQSSSMTGLAGPVGPAGQGTNITLNFNQINLTTGSGRVQQQPSQQALVQQNNSLNTQGIASAIAPTGNSQGKAKQRYAATINLAGIKHISQHMLKQVQQNQQQQVMGNMGGGSAQGVVQPKNASLAGKRSREH